MPKVVRIILDIQVSWKCKLLKMMMLGLDLKFASLYYILFFILVGPCHRKYLVVLFPEFPG